jgi:hypothetical protein
MGQKNGLHLGSHRIAQSFISAFRANLPSGMLCGFVTVKPKCLRLPLSFAQLFSFSDLRFHLQDSRSTGVNAPFESLIF